MVKQKLMSVAVVLLLASMASLVFTACQSGSGTEPALDEPPREALRWSSIIGRSCGGVTDPPCPGSFMCVTDPGEECIPGIQGCICVHGDAKCLDPDREYATRDPSECIKVSIPFIPGLSVFLDRCGCGNEPPPLGSSTCGEARCRPDEICCDPMNGRCGPRDEGCAGP